MWRSRFTRQSLLNHPGIAHYIDYLIKIIKWPSSVCTENKNWGRETESVHAFLEEELKFQDGDGLQCKSYYCFLLLLLLLLLLFLVGLVDYWKEVILIKYNIQCAKFSIYWRNTVDFPRKRDVLWLLFLFSPRRWIDRCGFVEYHPVHLFQRRRPAWIP